MSELSAATTRLLSLLTEYSPLALAFSGGLDSRFLAFAAQQLLPETARVHLYCFHGPHTQACELAGAKAWAENRHLPLTVLPFNPLAYPEVLANGKERCYHCKLALFRTLKQHVAEFPPFPGEEAAICDGSNATDAGEYRPGLRALRELSVRSPLAEAGLGKQDIHRLAADWGMDKPDQKARPCLLTRFAYGLSPAPAVLAALDKAEQRIQTLLEEAAAVGVIPPPLPDFRLRLVGITASTEQYTGTSGENTTTEELLSAYAAELHLAIAALPDLLADALASAVTGQGFAPPRLAGLSQLSGFYDRQHSGARP